MGYKPGENRLTMYKCLPVLVLTLAVFFALGLVSAQADTAGDQKEISALFDKGVSLFKNGEFNEAREKFNEILEINPTYAPARSKLRLINIYDTQALRRSRTNAEKEMILDVEKKWFPPSRDSVLEISKIPAASFKTAQQKQMEEKAQQIIPEINFTDAHIRDVLQYLSRVSGVNIILDESIFVEHSTGELGIPLEIEITETAGVSEEGDLEEGSFGEDLLLEPAPVSTRIVSDRVTISLKQIPLIEALKYILAAKGLKYRIDEYAILVSSPQHLGQEEMETRYYHLSSGIGTFTEFAEATDEEEDYGFLGEETEVEETTLNIKDVLEQSGVPFPAGSKVFLDQRTGTLIIRNTPSNLIIIEDILRILDVTPYQIEIEARFVQISADDAEELGLEWMIQSNNFVLGDGVNMDDRTVDSTYGRFPDPTNTYGYEGFTRGVDYLTGADYNGYDIYGSDRELRTLLGFADSLNPIGDILSISGILTEPKFRVILHALNQSGNANLVSAPKVTTLNNQRAQIEMVEEYIYPEEYEITAPTIRTDEDETTHVVTSMIITPGIAVPTSFETRNLGVILNVSPSVGSDRKTITLTLMPEISELVGEIDYGITAGPGWNTVPITKPIIETRNVTTSVVISDGETVVLGGLVTEEIDNKEDKIPLLGDIPLLGSLFRTRSSVTRKVNLIIFVTAKLLTPSGALVSETKGYAYQ